MHQTNNLEIGGVETYVYRLTKHANEPTFILSHKTGTVLEWFQELEIHGYIGSDYETVKNAVEFAKIDVFVMHTGSYLPEYFPQLKKDFPNMKFVVVLHTLYPVEYLDQIDALICVSDAVARMQPVHKKVTVIYPGVEKRELIIGNVTRIAPYKYINDLIECSRVLTEFGIPHLVAIVGEDAVDAPGFTEELKTIVKSVRIMFLGKLTQSELNSFYRNISIFVHPIGNEAYPAVILEALENNLPVITYARGGAVEIPGIIFVDNPKEIAREIVRIYSRVKDINTCAQEFSKVYEEICR